MFSALQRPASQLTPASRDPFSLVDALFSDWAGNRGAQSLVSRARLDMFPQTGHIECVSRLTFIGLPEAPEGPDEDAVEPDEVIVDEPGLE